MSKKTKMIEITGQIYDAETGKTESYTCEIPEPQSKPRDIKLKILRRINESAFLVEPEDSKETK